MEGFKDFIFDDEEDIQKDEYLTFVIDDEVYAIEIRYVTEIIGVPPITVLPNLEDYVKGLINLRGKFIPMMDVRQRLKKPAMPYTDRTCTIVVDYDEYTVGMIIDAVSDVVNIPEENIIEPPHTKTTYHHKFIRGMGRPALALNENEDDEVINENDIVLIMDLAKMFQTEEKGEEDDDTN